MLKCLFYKFGASRCTIITNSRSYVRRVRNPGIDKRLKLFSDDFVHAEFGPDMFENDVDSDFMNVGEAHKEFEKEEYKHKQKVHSMIVGRKFFNEKGINFLTWSEKEQIRYLNEQNPNEWDPEKLSQSFPADPLTISKIIRNKWQPKDEKRVQQHDKSVIKTWEKFRAGELEVEPILSDHLKKFTHRDFNELTKPKVNRHLGVELPKPTSNEFFKIISSCKKYTEKRESNHEKKDNVLQLESNEPIFPKNRPTDPEKDSFLLESKSRNTMKWLTLKEYEKHSPDIVQTKLSNNDVEPPDCVTLRPLKYHEAKVSTYSGNDLKVFRSLDVKQFIEIPRNVWKKDQIYKVGDCFYADDGEFLYRVPGLK